MEVIFFFLGAILASFVGVVTERIHTGQSWLSGRSRCDACGTHLTVRDLVPLVSYVASLGKCRTCGSRISATHLVGEAVLGSVFVVAYLSLGLSFELLIFLVALIVLFFIVRYDLRHTVIPPYANLLFALCAVVFAYMTAPSLGAFLEIVFVAGVFGGAFLLLHLLSQGRAMGLADAPLVFSLSLLAGVYAFGGLLLSFWIGGAYGIVVLLTRRGGPTMGIEVPFAPFLALGFILAYFFAWNPLLPLL